MQTCTRRLSFDAGHRVLGHDGKCRHLHGHRYDVDITIYAVSLNGLGMVVDFSAIKNLVGRWIDENLDHNMILHEDDPLAKIARTDWIGLNWTDKEKTPGCMSVWTLFGGTKGPYIMEDNPTAENLARLIYDKAVELLPFNELKVMSVRVYETPNCWSDFPGPPSNTEKGVKSEAQPPTHQ
jgi:6-pyruvoyltetrahydropterin/6-carboxytetrahydropterin synthase